jgi:hypothetical protein
MKGIRSKLGDQVYSSRSVKTGTLPRPSLRRMSVIIRSSSSMEQGESPTITRKAIRAFRQVLEREGRGRRTEEVITSRCSRLRFSLI